MTPLRFAAAILTVATVFGCGAGPAGPSALDTRGDACAYCRMPVSDARLAAQLASPSEETRFFDDIGCLRAHLAGARTLPPHAAAYVADHETGRWIPASSARYERCPGIETPMGSHLIAHDAATPRTPDARCEPLSASDVFGAGHAPGEAPR